LLSAVLFALVGCQQKKTPSQAPAAPAAAPDAGGQQQGSGSSMPGMPGSDAVKVDKK
jgi:hypothetical protein